MLDYIPKEQNANFDPEAKDVPLQLAVQETFKILNEMDCTLNDFESTVCGRVPKEEDRRGPNCLCDEARLTSALAYECLKKLQRIKNSIC